MNINDQFPSKYLKAANITDTHNVTINGVMMETLGDGEQKPVIFFNEHDKGVVLNKTNANNIAELYGPETDNWIGKQMSIATAWVDMQGKSVQGIRLYPPIKGEQQNTGQNFDERNPPPSEGNAYADQRG